jgi:hypothetical protein
MVAPPNSPPPADAKPKRKYTVSDKVRAANRLNLAQANADPEKKYRPTPKRLASTYANCLKAREGKRRKRSRGLATGVKYGLAVVVLYTTLGLADATRAELDEHYQLFRDRLKPAYAEEDKLTQALAECGWRRSQVLHVHAVDEAMLMKARLIMASDLSRDNVSARSLALLMMEVFTRRRPDLEEQLGILTRHFERLSYLLLLLRNEHEGFGEKIRWGRELHGLLRLPAEALGNPFLSGRKVEAILREKSNAIKPLEEMQWKGKEKEQEERREKFQKDCEEATYGGPCLGGPEKVKGLGTVAYVKDGGQTQAVVGPAGGPAGPPSGDPAEDGKPGTAFVMVEGTGALEAGLSSTQWPEEEERKLVAELRRQWIETSEQLRQERKDTVGGLDLDELGGTLDLAFYARGEEGVGSGEEQGVETGESGEESGIGSGESGVGSGESGVGEEEEGVESRESGEVGSRVSSPTPDSPPPTPDPPSAPPPTPDDPSSSPTPDSPLPPPGHPAPDLREVTATAWDRVRFLEWWSRWERREMKAILQRTGQPVEKAARTVLEALLHLFRGYQKILFEARHYEAKLRDALYRFLSALYGGDPGFEPPSPVWIDPELFQQMMHDMEGVWGN